MINTGPTGNIDHLNNNPCYFFKIFTPDTLLKYCKTRKVPHIFQYLIIYQHTVSKKTYHSGIISKVLRCIN